MLATWEVDGWTVRVFPNATYQHRVTAIAVRGCRVVRNEKLPDVETARAWVPVWGR